MKKSAKSKYSKEGSGAGSTTYEKKKIVDLLSEDKEVPNQYYVWMSLICPEDIIKRKELYFFEQFLKKWEFNKSMEKFVQN